jgi:glyoxylase-like metal-dependent hydrolase (beta-lactamase superfamily II)
VLGEGSTIVPSRAHGGSLSDYMRSLDRLRALRPSLLCPGHGPWIADPDARVAEYIDHRKAREAKLVAALEGGERSRPKLLEAAWDDVPDPLRAAAAVAMEAHLEKLEAEGRLPAGLEP